MTTEKELREIIKNRVISHITRNLENAHELLEYIKEYTDTEIQEYIKKSTRLIQSCVEECIEGIVEYYAEGNPAQFYENITEKYIEENLYPYIEECIEQSMLEDAWE